jgi:hypothetical protein
MKNYICKWPNRDIVLICARDRQQLEEILDEQGDPGRCEVVRVKGAFAVELIPKLPAPPQPAGGLRGARLHTNGSTEYQAPSDATVRPQIFRWVGNTGKSTFADLYEEAGGQLTTAEAAAVQRWRTATQQQPGAAAAAAAGEEPWVTEDQLQATGMLDDPYHVQVDLGKADYDVYSSRLLKQITKHFFPRTHQALKTLAAVQLGEQNPVDEAGAVWQLRAALSADIDNKEKQEEADRNTAQLLAAAGNGNGEALLQVMLDQTVNMHGPVSDDEDDDDFESSDEDEDE